MELAAVSPARKIRSRFVGAKSLAMTASDGTVMQVTVLATYSLQISINVCQVSCDVVQSIESDVASKKKSPRGQNCQATFYFVIISENSEYECRKMKLALQITDTLVLY